MQTVLGPRPADALGVIDAHCHLHIAGGPPGSPQLNHDELAAAELQAFAAAGGGAVLDCQPGACGRDGWALARLMTRTGVAVVASTGFHMRRHYLGGRGPWHDPGGAYELFERELTDRLAEAPGVRAGAIKTAWSGEGDPAERELLLAAIEAARRTGAPVVVHTEAGRDVERLADLVEGSGLAPAQVQLSHVDKRPDRVLHAELARAGFVLGYDTWLRPKYDPENGVWALVRAMAGAGLAASIAAGLDLVDVSAWSVSGGAGLPALCGSIRDRLRDEIGGAGAAAICGGTAARLLAGARVETAA